MCVCSGKCVYVDTGILYLGTGRCVYVLGSRYWHVNLGSGRCVYADTGMFI